MVLDLLTSSSSFVTACNGVDAQVWCHLFYFIPCADGLSLSVPYVSLLLELGNETVVDVNRCLTFQISLYKLVLVGCCVIGVYRVMGFDLIIFPGVTDMLSRSSCVQMIWKLVRSSWILHTSCNKRRIAPIAALFSAVLHASVFREEDMHVADKGPGPMKWV